MPKGRFEVDMKFDRKTSGGQFLFMTVPEQKDNAGARNLYCTKNSFPPGVQPETIKVTVEYETP